MAAVALAASSSGVTATTAVLGGKQRKVHGIMCVYLGDAELDIGKTARWLQGFCDTVFFFDATPSTLARQYAIDYAKSWPDTKFAAYPSGSTSFFVQPEIMRQAAFAAAKAAWNYDPNDWVLFCDASESVSVDVPLDQLVLKAGSDDTWRYLYDEVSAAAGTEVAVPVRIFLTQGTVGQRDLIIDLALSISTDQRIAIVEDSLANGVLTDEERAALNQELADLQVVQQANKSIYWTVDPHYLALTGTATNAVRLVKVSRLTSGFDFKKIDTYGSAGNSAAAHVCLVSYAYARYSEVDYHNPALWTRPNDQGYTSRQYIQQVPGRHLVLPTTDAEYGTPDPAGQGLLSLIPAGPAQINAQFDVSDRATIDFQGFVNNPTGTETYDWNFNDGTAHGTQANMTHKFPTAPGTIGNYTVVLTVGPGARVSTVTVTIDLQSATSAGSAIGVPNVVNPPDPATALLAPAYCYYIEKVRTLYTMVISALWRMNPRDGVWYEQYNIGAVPLDPITGQPDVGVDPDTGEAYDPANWDTQQPSARNRL